jgi:predicted metal-binding membrane protein
MWATSDRRLFTPLLAALIALAWLILWVWGRSPYGRFLAHEALGEAGLADGALLPTLVFVAGWTLMTIAMMLPTSLPLVALFQTVVRRRKERVHLVALLITGYLAIWTLFGGVVHLADRGLHEVVERSPWLFARAWSIGAATILLAGLYQFSSLKYRCLEKCRAPLSFIAARWRGGRERARAFGIGVSHGLYCLGCCWSLMLLMFSVGIGNLGWMLALGAVMAVEKNVSWGRRITAPLGGVLVGWALYLFGTGLAR